MVETIVLKLGGSVITKKKDDLPEVDAPVLERLSKEISEALQEKNFNLFIVHGVGPYGHVFAKKYKLDEPLHTEVQIKGIGITHRMVELLNYTVVDQLQKDEVNAINLQPSACTLLSNGRIIGFPIELVKKYMDLGLVPVAYGDTVLDENKGIGILSGDQIAPYVAQKLKADKVIFGADVDGVFTKDPFKNQDAKLLPLVTKKILAEEIEELGGSNATDVTGGMFKKVHELLDLADQGIESQIINATKSGMLKKALLGEQDLGTIIKG